MAYENAAKERYLKQSQDLQSARENYEFINERLKDEEKKRKEWTDKQVTAEQTMENTKEDYEKMSTK